MAAKTEPSRRGQPLLAMAGILLLWICLRSIWFELPVSSPVKIASIAAKTGFLTSIPPANDQFAANENAAVWSSSPFDIVSVEERGRLSVTDTRNPSAPARLRPHEKIDDAITGDQPVEQANLEPRQAVAKLEEGSNVALDGSRDDLRPLAPSRWSGDAWVLWRRGGAGIANGVAAPVYGGSQAGAVVRYSLNPEGRGDVAIFFRAVRALDPSHDGDLAVGLAARPLASLPATVHGEVRLSSRGSKVEVRPAAFIAAGFDQNLEGRGLAMRGYAQAGYVGGRDATGFVDGSVVAEAGLLPSSELRVRAGAGSWGGVQRGAGRLDVGPTVSMNVRLGDTSARFSADYRLRIAGNAGPAAGAALTLSAGF